MAPLNHPPMVLNTPICLYAAQECESQANTLADYFEEAGIAFSTSSDDTPWQALVLLVSPRTSYEHLRAVVVLALVRRAFIILLKMAPSEIPEEAREALRDAVIIDAGSGMKEAANDLVRALQHCGVLMEKPTMPIRPLP